MFTFFNTTRVHTCVQDWLTMVYSCFSCTLRTKVAGRSSRKVRVTTCMENMEMSGNLTAMREMSGILLKVREMSGTKTCQGKVALNCLL